MSERARAWRDQLMGPAATWSNKREMFEHFVRGRSDIEPDILAIIRADLPRTYPEISSMETAIPTISSLLVSYAAVHRGDGYLQGFNYIMAILWFTFKEEEYAEADTWWCFTKIVGLIRPLMPDFNVAWFHWYRKHWFKDFQRKLKKKRPLVESIIAADADVFSNLVTVKWFMIWFAQTFTFDEIFLLWDFILSQPKERLVHVYALITYEIIYEAAPILSYKWSKEPTGLLHKILSLKVQNVPHLIQRVKSSV